MDKKKDEEKRGELSAVNIEVVENGFSLKCTYEDGHNTVSKRAGWVPSQSSQESYVAKTKAEVLQRLKEVL